MDVDEVAAALAEVALVDKPVGSWDEEEDSVRAALADESVVEAAARMDAEEEGLRRQKVGVLWQSLLCWSSLSRWVFSTGRV